MEIFSIFTFVLLHPLRMNSKQLLISVTFVLTAAFGLTSCKKEAGQGGTSTITGKVTVYDFDPTWTNIGATYPARDEDVYIIYGADHSTYDDDYKTTHDGTYRFNYLEKGKYQLFAYTKDSTGAFNGTYNSANPKIPVFVNVEITGKNQTVVAPEIIILKNNQ